MITLLWTLWSCASLGPLKADHEALVEDLARAEANQYALACAPRELALAQSNREFAELEFKQGDARRAEYHMDIARDNIAAALRMSKNCEPKDQDKDGLTDDIDKCPTEPEDFDQFEDGDGCPDLDRDKDTLADAIDKCPDDPEDFDSFQDADGCPDFDNDNDGIVDVNDRCPLDPEDMDGDDDTDGCPESAKDRDGDGYIDSLDKCPDEPETFNEYLDEDGCPDSAPSNVKITATEIKIDQQIKFEVAKARILPASYPILNSVAQVLKDYPNVKIHIEGHTDSDGSDSFNLKLSDDRARSVYEYLVGQGIPAERMSSQGLGETKPIDTNNTAAGKANNRRVEFHIVSGM